MKDWADLSRGLLRKAASDTVALEAALGAGAFDAACFHAQQAAEKCLKAYLTYARVEFPYTHNLAKLIDICAGLDAAFRSLLPIAAPLTPYAVELRYDDLFWPSESVTKEARDSALAVTKFVLDRLPLEIKKAGAT